MDNPDPACQYSGHVAILIVSYKCAFAVRSCIESLCALKYASFEIHVIENGGREHYADLKASLSDLMHFEGRAPAGAENVQDRHCGVLKHRNNRVFLSAAASNLGFAGGVNAMLRAIEDSDWSAVWILNPDTRVDPNSLSALMKYASDSGAAIVGSRLIHEDSRKVQLYGGHWRPWIARGLALGLGSAAEAAADVTAIERQLDFVSGASMLVSRAYISRIGLMDEGYFLYYEEVDWCFRRGDFRLGYAHDSIVFHDNGLTTGASMSKKTMSPLSVYLDERNKLIFSRKYFPRRYPFTVLICLLLTAQYLRARAFSNFVIALRGWWAGVRGQRGQPTKLRPV